MKSPPDLTQELRELKQLLQQLSGSTDGIYIDNSYQMPNFITDFLDYYLTPVESKVLYRIVREILGWKKRISRDTNVVSLSKILKGYRTEDGLERCLGIGLTHETLERTVEQLCAFNILTQEQRTQKGCVYRLNFNTGEYDVEALRQRVEQRKHMNRRRMQKARQANSRVK
jgi:hypothetical protein